MMTARQTLTRYSASLLLVLAVHAVAIIIALRWSSPQVVELPPAPMIVELAPLPQPAPLPPPRVVQPQPPAPVEEVPLPKVAEAPKPEIAIPKPVKPKVKPQPPKPEKKPEPPQEKPADIKPVETPPTSAPSVKSAAPPQPPSPPSPAVDSNAKRTWQSDLQQHLAKYQKYPEEVRRRNITGSTSLRFEVDADGKVISVSIAESSGNALLDRATLEMIRRAQPLPKPPVEILRNGSVEVSAPFTYRLTKR
jgi:periplasmic protein TonB